MTLRRWRSARRATAPAARSPRVDGARLLPAAAALGMVLVTVVVGLLVVHDGCRNPPPPLSLGQGAAPGTPRADLCDVVDRPGARILLFVVPLLSTGLALLVRWRPLALLVASAWLVALAVLMWLAASLDAALTV